MGPVNIGFKTLEEGQEDPVLARTSLINLKNENKKNSLPAKMKMIYLWSEVWEDSWQGDGLS